MIFVGVLVEVPVMLSLVAFANRTRRHFRAGNGGGLARLRPAAALDRQM